MTAPIPEAEPHVRAVREMLAAALAPFNIGVALSVGPARTPPYIAIHPDPGDVATARLDGGRSHLVIHFMLHAVGVGPEQALWALDKARARMLGAPPAVPARKLHRMTQTGGSPAVQRDETVQPPLYIAYAGFRLFSQAA